MTPAWLPDTVTTDPQQMVRLALLWGIDGLELRLVGKTRVPGVNESALRRRVQESELDIVSISPGLFEGPSEDRSSWMNELALLEESLEFCRRNECRLVVVSGFSTSGPGAVEALRDAGARAASAGCRVAVLNEEGMACEKAADLGALIEKVAHPAVCAAWQLTAQIDEEDRMAMLCNTPGVVRCNPLDIGLHHDEVFSGLHSGGFRGPVSMVIPTGAERGTGLHASSKLIQSLRRAKTSA